MQFLSVTWLAWMTGTVSAYWIAPREWRDLTLVGISLAFLAVHSPESAALLTAFAGAVYYLSNRPGLGSARAISVSAFVVAVLTYYKLRAADGGQDFFSSVAIPLGLSYYSFRCVHYVIEKYKGTLDDHGFREFISYLFFLPTLVVGPIHRFGQFHHDLRYKRWDGRLIAEGLERILYGYAKIAFLGNYLVSGKFAGYIASLDGTNPALVYYLEIVRNGLNLYFQFAGFSDIAIGFSLLLGYRIIENFNWPFIQKNISDFWRCWHISLTSWCRDYIYTVVMSVTRMPYLAVLATLIVIGMWHEVSPRYLLWGIYHGVGVVTWQLFQKAKAHLPEINNVVARRAVDGVSILATVHFVWFSFVLISQPSFAAALSIYHTVLFSWW